MMPSLSAASMTLVPAGTSISRESMMSFGMVRTVLSEGALALADVLPEFIFKVREKTLHRLCGPWGKCAIGIAHVRAHFPKHGDETLFTVAILYPPQQVPN